MTNAPTPDPVPVPPENEPDQIFPSATGVVVPEEGADSASTNDSTPPES